MTPSLLHKLNIKNTLIREINKLPTRKLKKRDKRKSRQNSMLRRPKQLLKRKQKPSKIKRQLKQRESERKRKHKKMLLLSPKQKKAESKSNLPV